MNTCRSWFVYYQSAAAEWPGDHPCNTRPSGSSGYQFFSGLRSSWLWEFDRLVNIKCRRFWNSPIQTFFYLAVTVSPSAAIILEHTAWRIILAQAPWCHDNFVREDFCQNWEWDPCIWSIRHGGDSAPGTTLRTSSQNISGPKLLIPPWTLNTRPNLGLGFLDKHIFFGSWISPLVAFSFSFLWQRIWLVLGISDMRSVVYPRALPRAQFITVMTSFAHESHQLIWKSSIYIFKKSECT